MAPASPQPRDPRSEFDYALVGGGLQSGLLALAIRDARPDARIALVEREDRLGGNHTWCFHDSDLSPAALRWIEPAVERRWNGYSVRFPDTRRDVAEGYACVVPARLEAAVGAALAVPGSALLRGETATEITPDTVTLASGTQVRARLVVDARGPRRAPVRGAGFQKFVGQELQLAAPHGLTRPVLMDATVDQTDGYRFFYLLPFAPDRILVEDTRFTNDPAIDGEAFREEIENYCERAGWRVREVLREEEGVLPMPWTAEAHPSRGGVLEAGYRGGWFHPGTGYSLPVAARLAEAVASGDPDAIRQRGLPALRREHDRQARYCHVLNRFLFQWYPPRMRWHIFARFYRMPLPLIRRFYALRMNRSDQARLLVGKPPRGLSLRYRMAPGGAS